MIKLADCHLMNRHFLQFWAARDLLLQLVHQLAGNVRMINEISATQHQLWVCSTRLEKEIELGSAANFSNVVLLRLFFMPAIIGCQITARGRRDRR